jgi:hypothetical protein
MRRATLAWVFLLVVPAFAMAQSGQDSWVSLGQLHAGQKIQVVDTNLKSTDGTFLSFTEESISFQVKHGAVTVKRSDVMRVSSREKSKRVRNMLIGLAIGAGAGVAIGAAMDARVNYERGECCIGITLGLLAGAPTGLGLGAASASYQTICRAPKR